jgi:hypothetical protein
VTTVKDIGSIILLVLLSPLALIALLLGSLFAIPIYIIGVIVAFARQDVHLGWNTRIKVALRWPLEFWLKLKTTKGIRFPGQAGRPFVGRLEKVEYRANQADREEAGEIRPIGSSVSCSVTPPSFRVGLSGRGQPRPPNRSSCSSAALRHSAQAGPVPNLPPTKRRGLICRAFFAVSAVMQVMGSRGIAKVGRGTGVLAPVSRSIPILPSSRRSKHDHQRPLRRN